MLLTFCLSIIIVVLLTGAHCAKQPHILFILADDYGWNDIGSAMFSETNFFQLFFNCFFENFSNFASNLVMH